MRWLSLEEFTFSELFDPNRVAEGKSLVRSERLQREREPPGMKATKSAPYAVELGKMERLQNTSEEA